MTVYACMLVGSLCDRQMTGHVCRWLSVCVGMVSLCEEACGGCLSLAVCMCMCVCVCVCEPMSVIGRHMYASATAALPSEKVPCFAKCKSEIQDRGI